MKKTTLTVLGCFGATALCLIVMCGGLAYRYVSAGVNPFREIKMAVAGESIEIGEVTELGGNRTRRLLIDSIDHGTQFQPGKIIAGAEQGKNVSPRVPTSY